VCGSLEPRRLISKSPNVDKRPRKMTRKIEESEETRLEKEQQKVKAVKIRTNRTAKKKVSCFVCVNILIINLYVFFFKIE
jgi:t-SNARE complex subunit (syntaxin)